MQFGAQQSVKLPTNNPMRHLTYEGYYAGETYCEAARKPEDGSYHPNNQLVKALDTTTCPKCLDIYNDTDGKYAENIHKAIERIRDAQEDRCFERISTAQLLHVIEVEVKAIHRYINRLTDHRN